MGFYILKGLLIGFSIAAPVGPIGVLCIRRTLASGRLYGLVSGLGAATADAVYGSIAGFGLTLISSFLLNQQTWIRLIGGAFLCYLGIKTLLARPLDEIPEGEEQAHTLSSRNNELLSDYFSTFFLTLTNPLTILSFSAIFAGLGLGAASGDYTSAGMLVGGVFLGSASWWFILSFGISLFRHRLGQGAMRWVNRVSGSIILGFGILALWSVVSSARIS
jgi:threonine/homoserine/homoserine lactone efflux protein